jgi:hypothetical protein
VKKILELVKVMVVMATVLMSVSMAPCAAQDLGSVPGSIRTPEQIVSWFNSEFEYRMKMPDRPQSPAETMELRSGDCDDFASLAKMILEGQGIKSDVVIIKYRGLNIMHAICMYKESNGTYSFISNKELQRTGEADMTHAVAKFYPDMEKIMVANADRSYMETVAGERR